MYWSPGIGGTKYPPLPETWNTCSMPAEAEVFTYVTRWKMESTSFQNPSAGRSTLTGSSWFAIAIVNRAPAVVEKKNMRGEAHAPWPVYMRARDPPPGRGWTKSFGQLTPLVRAGRRGGAAGPPRCAG
jgi:hypothetical protein